MSNKTIIRKGYTRKAHERQAYTRTTPSGGTIKIAATYVKETEVPPTRIKDVGLPGKTPESRKVLPKPSGVMSSYGYSTKKSTEDRRKAIHKAIKDKSYATVHRELVLVRTYTSNSQPANAKKYDMDLKYMERNYETLKELEKS